MGGENIMGVKVSKEIEQSIIDLYQNTSLTYNEISKKLKVGHSTISNVLQRNDITRNHQKYNTGKTKGKGKILSIEQEKEVINLYQTGKFTQKLLAEKFNCSTFVISNVLTRNNIPKIQHFNTINKDLKHNYFSVIDNEYKAYFLGFIFGDGNVFKNQLSLEINEKDIDLLHIFKKQLNSIAKISYRQRKTGNMVSTRVTSTQLVNDLQKYGIVPNKTQKTKHLPIEFIPQELIPHFIRGLIDSDGWITQSKQGYWKIGFVTNYKQVALEFKQLCNKILPADCQIKSNITFKNKNRTVAVCQIQSQKIARELATLVYKGNKVCLTRKFNRAKLIYESNKDNDIV